MGLFIVCTNSKRTKLRLPAKKPSLIGDVGTIDIARVKTNGGDFQICGVL
ncbi:MAG: hypothetical protein IKT58_06980 [Oscillospiraceae bacterium]|nr:hypothetical protein [Oscillospiraceae bacterium]